MTTLEDVYAELPELDCQRRCSLSCGPILMTRLEWARIDRPELRVIDMGGGVGPGGEVGLGFASPDLTCPLLERGACSVYELRPAICRLWGIVETMKCPWGCVPVGGWWPHTDGMAWLTKVAVVARGEQPDPAA